MSLLRAFLKETEPLKCSLASKWSRRITNSDKLVYEVKKKLIIIHTLRGHYI